jgi:hypothetical protein
MRECGTAKCILSGKYCIATVKRGGGDRRFGCPNSVEHVTVEDSQ